MNELLLPEELGIPTAHTTASAYFNRNSGYDNDAWGTPLRVYNPLNDEFHFTLDVCASDDNHKCDRYFTEEIDGLAQEWFRDICFMNPPYSDTDRWLEKAYFESLLGATVVALVKADTSTEWFHRWYEVAKEWPNECRFLGRIQFDPPPGYVGSIDPRTKKVRGKPGSPNMGSALIVFRPRNRDLITV